MRMPAYDSSAYIRRIVLDNVINLGNIETTSGNIGTDENTSFAVDEFEECRSTLLLFLLAVDGKNLYDVRVGRCRSRMV